MAASARETACRPPASSPIESRVARNTVSAAYERLIAEGFVSGRMGAGTFVTDSPMPGAATRRAPSGADLRPLGHWERIAPWPPPAREAAYDFRVGTPDGRLFPHTAWRRLVAREL